MRIQPVFPIGPHPRTRRPQPLRYCETCGRRYSGETCAHCSEFAKKLLTARAAEVKLLEPRTQEESP